MDFVGPQGTTAVSEQLVERYPDMVRFDPADPIARRWHNFLVRTTTGPRRA